jgi:uncharacterized protein (UPF0262 family)
VPLVAVAVDPALQANAPPARRAEWDLASLDVLDEHELALPPGDFRLHVELGPLGTTLRFLTEPAEASLSYLLPSEALAPHLREYTQICRRMTTLDEGGDSPRLEVLDMAKKLAHDDGGRCILRVLSPLDADLATGRRLFTLLFTLHVDTTTLRAFHLGHLKRPSL